jgi:hypothetical protein
MKPIKPLPPPNFGPSTLSDDVDDLAKIAGLSLPGKGRGDFADSVISKVSRKPPISDHANTPHLQDRDWTIHQRFESLHQKFGRPFFLFLTDLLDVILSGPSQEKLFREIDERKRRTRKDASESRSLTAPGPTTGKVLDVAPKQQEITIGGETFFLPQSFLKRKGTLAGLFLESEEYPLFLKLMKQIREVCEAECTLPREARLSEGFSRFFPELAEALKLDMSRENLLNLWVLLDQDDFCHLEDVFQQTKDFGLIPPSFYEDLDKAYREGKKLLKLLMTEFSEEDFPGPEKKEFLLEYLQNIFEVYTYHHFIVKSNQKSRVGMSRKEFEKREKENRTRIEGLRKEAQEFRDACQKLQTERDLAAGEARSREVEAQELRDKLRKYDPAEVDKNLRAMESRLNALQREKTAVIEEDADLRTALRTLDAENQQLTQQLRSLNALPDENAKSVDNLLVGKRVVVFGGVGRDHYWPLLKEAGVHDEDYEWYEGYHTISQARTNDICGRADVVAIVTSYAGHLILWQVRNCIRPDQTLFLIHKSGAGSLRQHIIDAFRKGSGEKR